MRPFVEVCRGIETLIAGGVDVTPGRRPDTGQRFSAVQEPSHIGFSLILGADVAHVAVCDVFPANGPVQRRETRARLHWRNRAGSRLF